MKWFKCEEHGPKKGAKGTVEIEVEFYFYHNEPRGDLYDEEIFYPRDVNAAGLRCKICGERVVVVDIPCSHKWGETQFGYGDAKGQVKRACTICGERQIGLAVPEWTDD